MKKSDIILIIVLLLIILGSGFYIIKKQLLPQKTLSPVTEEKHEAPQQKIIGGDKDDHGCLIGAGYSWCDAKDKCLRVWEEPCVAPENQKTTDSIDYKNTDLGFSLKLPKAWEGFTDKTTEDAVFSQTSFSFQGKHQPFTIFQIIKRTPSQWADVPNQRAYKLLNQDKTGVFVCDGCCGTGDTTGGGQFDAFQQERCSEAADIMKSFRVLK